MRTDLSNMFTALALATALTTLTAPAAAGGVPIIPFEEIRPGMTGTGRTVFEGTTIAEFQVEILGVLPRIGPDRNLILARCTGGPLEETGILAGMSGSPIYIDGRLAGALAYGWGFARDPIAGITPIEEMLAMTGPAGPAGSPRSVVQVPGGPGLNLLLQADEMDRFFQDRLTDLVVNGAGSRVALPVSISGFGPTGFRNLADHFGQAGLLPLQGGGGKAEGSGGPLQPGSAIGVKLVRGDVEITATGTVTWVDRDQVLAFGHPMFSLGRVDLPMTAARVETLLPSLQISSRITRTLEEVGALRQDRPSGIQGVIGARPRMIPVRLRYSDGAEDQTYSFDVADDPMLAPALVFYTLGGILAGKDRPGSASTLTMAEGSVIKLQGQDDVSLSNLFTGTSSQFFAAGTTAYILHLLMNNEWETPAIAGINLVLEQEPEPKTGRVTGLTLDRYRARPGDTVQVTVTVAPWRGPEVAITRDLVLPARVPSGKVRIQAGGVLELLRADGSADRQVLPHRLDQFIHLINTLRKNDRIFVMATRPDTVRAQGGALLPNLPPSAVALLETAEAAPPGSRTAMMNIAETSIPVKYQVHGLATAVLEVE